MDNFHNEEMPTVLIRKKPKYVLKEETVPREQYDDLEAIYRDLRDIAYDLLDTVDRYEVQIEELKQENQSLREQLNRTEAFGISYDRNKPGKKFQGATLSYDPHSKSLGIGLKFSH